MIEDYGLDSNYDFRGQAHKAHQANARLIAAAPDLLAACIEIARIGWHSETEGKPDLSWEDRWRIVAIARDAIAKAEGK